MQNKSTDPSRSIIKKTLIHSDRSFSPSTWQVRIWPDLRTPLRPLINPHPLHGLPRALRLALSPWALTHRQTTITPEDCFISDHHLGSECVHFGALNLIFAIVMVGTTVRIAGPRNRKYQSPASASSYSSNCSVAYWSMSKRCVVLVLVSMDS